MRALLARVPEEYEWSSAGAHLAGAPDRSRVLDMDFWRRAGGVETWREMHGSAEDPASTLLLRRCSYAGRPFGGEDFVGEIESKFGRKWRRWGFEKVASTAAVA